MHGCIYSLQEFRNKACLLCLALLLGFGMVSCSKKRTYRCKKGCVTIGVEGRLIDQNQATASKATPYKILFMPTQNGWIDFEADREYVVAEGTTDAAGIMKANIKVGEAELKGDHSVYIRYYNTEPFHFCDNPAYYAIHTVPPDLTDIHTLNIYQRKKIDLQLQKTDTAAYDQVELLVGAPTICTFGFLSDPILLSGSGTYPAYTLLNRSNLLTVKKTRFGTPNTYEWAIDSVYVDASTTQYTMNY
jgi:hypothetical protein